MGKQKGTVASTPGNPQKVTKSSPKRDRKQAKGSNRGAQGFQQYYADFFGERWPTLARALAEKGVYAEVCAPGRTPYYLNRASALIIEGLGIQPGNAILDLCAAPGGKSLVAALQMGSEGTLNSNDISQSRRRRLQKTLGDSLSPELFERVTISGHDGSRWGLYEQDRYDRIILDAPCSSEGHYIQQPKLQEQWSLGRIKRIAITQYALLAAAFTALKPGGIMVYSTCALLPQENDMVIAKLIKRHKDSVEILPPPAVVCNPEGYTPELTEYGLHYLPDQVLGYGPLYAGYIRKIAL